MSEKAFDQEKALRILEAFGTGRFEVVMDYDYSSAEDFYRSSIEFIPERRRHAYKKALMKEFRGF